MEAEKGRRPGMEALGGVGGVLDGGEKGPDVLGFGCLEKALLLVVDVRDAELSQGGAYLIAVPAASGQNEDLIGCDAPFFFVLAEEEPVRCRVAGRSLRAIAGAERFLGFGQQGFSFRPRELKESDGWSLGPVLFLESQVRPSRFDGVFVVDVSVEKGVGEVLFQDPVVGVDEGGGGTDSIRSTEAPGRRPHRMVSRAFKYTWTSAPRKA